ncbi:MAG: CRISPR-associated protein Cas4 [Chloroflexi bacterium]|nr:CRISPR-associated protein Cas4 [Chloroflexota bacterium]
MSPNKFGTPVRSAYLREYRGRDTVTGPRLILLAWALILFVGGLLVLRRSRRLHQQTGLPQGRVIYADTGAWNRCEKPLFSRRYLLTGRPDYLVDDGGAKIPVEVKSTSCPPSPYRSHVLQLAAYCLLVEEEYGQPPPYGIIKYQDQACAIEYTAPLRAELLTLLAEMRQHLTAADVGLSHANPNRCRSCGYREECEERLA